MDNEKLVELLEEIAPPEAGADWDNSGIQIQIHSHCRKVLVALEITHRVIDEAIAKEVDWIVTHHPLFFDNIKSFNAFCREDPVNEYALRCIRENINVYSTHIPFDNALGGNNEYLGKLLKLEDVHRPETVKENIPFVVGTLSRRQSLKEFVSLVKETLDLEWSELQVVEGRQEKIQKVGITTGGGSDFFTYALQENCEAFLTGELKYHDSLKAKELGLHMVGAGHYGTVKIFIKNMAEQLRQHVPASVMVVESVESTNPYVV